MFVDVAGSVVTSFVDVVVVFDDVLVVLVGIEPVVAVPVAEGSGWVVIDVGVAVGVPFAVLPVLAAFDADPDAAVVGSVDEEEDDDEEGICATTNVSANEKITSLIETDAPLSSSTLSGPPERVNRSPS